MAEEKESFAVAFGIGVLAVFVAGLIALYGIRLACRDLQHQATVGGKPEIAAFVKTSEVCK